MDAVNANDAVVCVVGGQTSGTSGEGVDRASMGLPGAQLAFLQATHAAAVKAKKPFAVVVAQGKAFAEPWMQQSLPAILEAWQSGQAQGMAVAETLFGLNNPAGRTAVTFPASADMLPVFYNYHPTASRGGYVNPPVISGGVYPPASTSTASILWPFGHGLSYNAAFTYSNLKVSPTTIPAAGGTVTVTFSVKNTGTSSAEEVVQLYVRDEVSSVSEYTRAIPSFTFDWIISDSRLPACVCIDSHACDAAAGFQAAGSHRWWKFSPGKPGD